MNTRNKISVKRTSIKFTGLAGIIGMALAITMSGCDSIDQPTVTPTFTIIKASETVAPVPPTPLQSSELNPLPNFTPGAPPVSTDNPAVTITPTPAPTQESFDTQFVATDGLVIDGMYYPAPAHPAPTVLLLPMQGSNKDVWRPFATLLQSAGYNVLAVDLRGYGQTGGKVDWSLAPQDVQAVMSRLSTLPGIDPQRLMIIGADIGANLAVGACADSPGCMSAVLLSPSLDYQGITTKATLARYGKRPILIVTSRSDLPSASDAVTLDKLALGDHQLQLYEGTAHGTDLFSKQPALTNLIVQWLGAHLTP